MFGNTFTPSGKSGNGKFVLPWGVYLNVNPLSGTSYPYLSTIAQPLKFISLHQSFNVNTTCDPYNYWNVLYRGFDGSSSYTFASTNTSDMTPYTWTRKSISLLIVNNPVSWIAVYMDCSKVGSPGNLYVAAPELIVEMP